MLPKFIVDEDDKVMTVVGGDDFNQVTRPATEDEMAEYDDEQAKAEFLANAAAKAEADWNKKGAKADKPSKAEAE